MNNKLISNRSGQLLSYFNGQGKVCFDIPEAQKAMEGMKVGTLRELLSDMAKRGLLMRIKEGVYYIIPYEQDSELFMPDWHLLAQYLIGNGAHYIGYYSAMQIHNLITQPSLKEQIVVSKPMRPSEVKIKDVPFQFIYHNGTHFFGAKKMWIDSYHKVQCSDLEKTIVDCLFKPEYAGGIVEIGKAIHTARQRIDFAKLLGYVKRFDSQAVIKRLGYLLDNLNIDNTIMDELLNARTESYIVLDTELPNEGKYISRWRIRQNMDIETIQSAITT